MQKFIVWKKSEFLPLDYYLKGMSNEAEIALITILQKCKIRL